MKARELRDLPDEELAKRLAETRDELFRLRFQAATGALENTARLTLVKRDVARILGVQREREKAAEGR